MSLVHHDNRPYAEAAGDAAARAKDHLAALIENGKQSATSVIEKVMTEVPVDRIVRGKALRFDGNIEKRNEGLPAGILAAFPESNGEEQRSEFPLINQTLADTHKLGIHKHALSQVCQRVGFPWKYAQALREVELETWGLPLLAHNLNELYARKGGRFLLRSHDQELRGFLSDRYRRLDSRPLVEAFAGACEKVGAVPVQGYVTDTKVALKAMLPMVFEPAPNEVVAFYVYWGNSDYGNGAHELKVGILRLWCTNYAIMDDVLRQVHLGKRLTENISWSQKTYELDTKAMASAIEDIVSQSLNADRTTELCDAIRVAHEEKIDPRKAIARLKKDLTKGEAADVVEAFNSPDVENLPPGNTVWRMSNAISWVAGKTEDTERKLDLMKVAGKAMSWIQRAA